MTFEGNNGVSPFYREIARKSMIRFHKIPKIEKSQRISNVSSIGSIFWQNTRILYYRELIKMHHLLDQVTAEQFGVIYVLKNVK